MSKAKSDGISTIYRDNGYRIIKRFGSMLNISKFLPALALAAALAPFAANASSGQLSRQGPDQQQSLVSVFGDAHTAANSQGRANQSNPPAGLFVVPAPEYASAGSSVAINTVDRKLVNLGDSTNSFMFP